MMSCARLAPSYSVDTDLGSSIFFNESSLEEAEEEDGEPHEQEEDGREEEFDGLWSMHFDGAVNKDGVGARVHINPSIDEGMNYSFKLAFQCTNNEAECEALVLRLNLLKDKKVKMINVQGDSELVINQVKGLTTPNTQG